MRLKKIYPPTLTQKWKKKRIKQNKTFCKSVSTDGTIKMEVTAKGPTVYRGNLWWAAGLHLRPAARILIRRGWPRVRSFYATVLCTILKTCKGLGKSDPWQGEIWKWKACNLSSRNHELLAFIMSNQLHLVIGQKGHVDCESCKSKTMRDWKIFCSEKSTSWQHTIHCYKE